MDAFLWIVFIAIIAGVILLFVKIFAKSAEKIQSQSENKARLNSKMNSAMSHIEGLPLGQGVSTEIYYCEDKIVFIASNQEISLSRDKIISIDVSTGRNISDTLTGAVAGKYIIGGLSGAALGAIVSAKLYCIITYDKNGETKHIVFDTAASGTFADRMSKDFNTNSTAKTKNIEL